MTGTFLLAGNIVQNRDAELDSHIQSGEFLPDVPSTLTVREFDVYTDFACRLGGLDANNQYDPQILPRFSDFTDSAS